MALEKVAERPDQTLPLAGLDARPRPGLEGAARGGDGEIDVGLVAGRDMGDDFLGGGILDRERLAAAGVDPFAVDQHLMLFRQERRRGGTERWFAYGNGHFYLPGCATSPRALSLYPSRI